MTVVALTAFVVVLPAHLTVAAAVTVADTVRQRHCTGAKAEAQHTGECSRGDRLGEPATLRGFGDEGVGRGGNGFFNVPAWAGVAVEAGNAWATRREATFGGLRKDAALFLGLDTGLGPVYLGGGLDGDGNSAWYLFLGRGF